MYFYRVFFLSSISVLISWSSGTFLGGLVLLPGGSAGSQLDIFHPESDAILMKENLSLPRFAINVGKSNEKCIFVLPIGNMKYYRFLHLKGGKSMKWMGIPFQGPWRFQRKKSLDHNTVSPGETVCFYFIFFSGIER